MLQRYDISLDSKANRLMIKEFAVLGRKSRHRNYADSAKDKYSLIHEESYNVDIIRKAISTGREHLITELRSNNFYPIHSCVKILAEKVTELFEDNSDSFFEIFFDDLSLFSRNEEQ
jgi:hypothetical protein